jgi:hypothetical protein
MPAGKENINSFNVIGSFSAHTYIPRRSNGDMSLNGILRQLHITEFILSKEAGVTFQFENRFGLVIVHPPQGRHNFSEFESQFPLTQDSLAPHLSTG